LRKRLRLLSVIASVAPLLGLLGTVTGMITAFQTVAASAEALGRTELLATGIYEAMVTTAGGLIVAIPTLLAYHWISSRVDHLVAEMDTVTVDFIETHTIAAGSQSAPKSVSRRSEPVAETGVPGDGRLQLAAATA
jgi:biopolymer transport protein ExbB